MDVHATNETCPHWLVPLVFPFTSFSSLRFVDDKLENATQPKIWVKDPAPDMRDIVPKVVDSLWAFKIKPRWLTIGNAFGILLVVRVDAVVWAFLEEMLDV